MAQGLKVQPGSMGEVGSVLRGAPGKEVAEHL